MLSSHCRGRAAGRDRRRRTLLGRVGVRAAGSGLSRSSGHVGGRSRRGVVRGRSGRGSGDGRVLRVGGGCTHEYLGVGGGSGGAVGVVGRVRVRSQSQSLVCCGAGCRANLRFGAGQVLLLRVGGGRSDSRVQKRRSFALGEKGSAPGKRATGEAVRALSLIAVKRVVTGAPRVNFNRRVCEIGKRLAWECTEPAAEMWNRSSR